MGVAEVYINMASADVARHAEFIAKFEPSQIAAYKPE